MKPSISLLHATRGRPDQSLLVRAQWMSTADDLAQIEHIFAVDEDDSVALEATDGLLRVVVKNPRGCFKGYNLAAKKAEGDILVPIEDDLVAPKGWDTVVMEAYRGHLDEPAVLLVDDCLANSSIEWIYNQAYFKARGLYHDGYFGNFGDTEVRDRIRADGVLRIQTDLKLDHRHHSRNVVPFDEIYQRKQSYYREDEALYGKRKANGWR